MTETQEITHEQVLTEMDELVAVVGPDHRAQRYLGSNLYVTPAGLTHPARPECLIGRWLHRSHNIALDWLHRHEGVSIETLIVYLTDAHLLPPVQPKAQRLLSFMQDKQDAGLPWGEVLERGQHYVAGLTEVGAA
jgi:hypothetical protein